MNIELVTFIYGTINKIPKMRNKGTEQNIVEMGLANTNTTVPNSHFFAHCGKNLKTFTNVGYNKMSLVDSGFQNCTDLKYLSLGISQISFIPSDAFVGLNKLILLELSVNDLTAISPAWFQDLGNLEHLEIRYNQLQDIQDDTFNQLTKLRKLYLTENKIKIIRRKVFQETKLLEVIDLIGNRIKEIQIDSFKHLSKMTVLNLADNNCIEINFKNKTSEEIAAGLMACKPTPCIIPTIKNGRVISLKDNSTQFPDDSMEESESVKVICDSNYTLIANKANQSENMCLEVDWQEQEWPECHSQYKHTPT